MIWQPLGRLSRSSTGIGASRFPRQRTARKRLRLEPLEGRLVLAAPVAVDDAFTAFAGTTLVVPAAGVLANDSDADGDIMRAVLAGSPASGTLNLAADGSFSYTPNNGFTGVDTFTYRAATDPAIVFAVDSSESSMNVTATVNVAGVGSRTDSDSTRISGTVTTRLVPTSAPFSSAHVVDLDLTLVDALDFSFNFTVATVSANAAAGSMHVTMETPGPAATVTAGSFTQVGNDLRVAGQANVSCSSFLGLCPDLPPNPQVFDTAGIITDIMGSLGQAGSTIALSFPINFTGTFDLGDGNTLDLMLEGTVNATGQASPPPEQSNLATVTITTVPPIETRADAYTVAEDQTLSVPASAPLRDEMLLPRGSLWRYLDDGSNQGTAWRATAFDDSGWKGPAEAEFGYGDGGEGTVINCDPNPADGCTESPQDLGDNFITSYFRRQIVLDEVGDIHELLVRFRRDDGGAVYVNGVEVVRDNLAPGAAFDTPAVGTASDDGATYIEFAVPADMLVVGSNVIAVEVHQASGSSSDVSFDLELVARRANLGVLANDVHHTGGALSASLVSPPVHGDLSLVADGSFVYTPDADYFGPDSFTYSAGAGATPQSVNIVVEPVDDPPVAANDGPYQAQVGTSLVVSASAGVLANDTDVEADALGAVLVSAPTGGTLDLASEGSFTYTPTTAGTDTFTYRAAQSTTLVPFGSRWRIMDDGSDQGTDWRAEAFDDSAWSIGLGEMGYGDGDETTLVRYGPSQSNKYVTTYFRHSFDVADASALAGLTIRAIRDDGIAVFLNGVEIGRDNLAADAAFNTLAGPTTIGGAAESTPVLFNVPDGLLVSGRNVLAVEVHQAAADSSDLSFDLELTGTLMSAPATVSIESTGSTAGPRVTGMEVQNATWSSDFRLFLQNNGLGSGAYAIPDGDEQLATLPWSGLSTIAVNFSDFVDDTGLIPAVLVGAVSGNVPLDPPITSEGPNGTLFAIWNLAGGGTLAADRYTFTLFDTARSPSGAELDGEWTTGASGFPSGDGAAGGDFVFEFRVLPGDVNRDAVVDPADIAANVAAGFRTAADVGYSPYHDVDGNGVVNFADAVMVRNRIPSSVASAAASAASAVVAAATGEHAAAAVTSATRTALRARSFARLAAVDRAIAEHTTAERDAASAALSAGGREDGTIRIRPRGRAISRPADQAETLGGPLE